MKAGCNQRLVDLRGLHLRYQFSDFAGRAADRDCLNGVPHDGCDLSTASLFMLLFEDSPLRRADPSHRTSTTPAAVPARVVLFEFETPLLHRCHFLARRGSAERCNATACF